MSELSYNGTVEVYREDGWIGVCGDSDWDVADAQVVCARLGYNQARVLTWTTSSVYSRWMYAVRCVGNESFSGIPTPNYTVIHCVVPEQ